MTDVTS